MAETFTSLDTLRQMGLVSLVYNDNHQLCLKFSCAGTGITFTGSMDSVLIIAAIKQQMTVDNIGLQGMVGPMGGMMTEYVPPPALPTVSWEGGDVGSYNWIYPHGMVQVASGESVTLYDDVSVGQYVTYNSSKTYSYSIWYASSGGSPIYGPGFLIVNSSGYIAAKNNTSSTLNLYAMRIAVCSSSSATVITVYNSSNVAYNAFQYTSDGTDYYYVLDGTQTDWTDDLSSIGYHLPPALPTVSDTMYLFNSSGGLGVGQINTLIDSNNNTVDYDTTACYACQNCMDSSGVAKNPTSLAIVNESGILKVTNISDNHISVYYVRTKKCSSNLATVITVYDSSNNPYNAFRYTSDGTDYYYVLDGTQTDWTDDLTSIGYRLDYIDIIVGIRWDPSTQTWLSKTFSGSSDWWWCGIINQSDISRLNNFGVGVITKSDTSSQWNGTIGAVAYNPDFDYTIEGFYSDFGETPVAYNLNDFFIARKSTTSSGNYDLSCLIHSVYATGEPVKSYRLRIRPGGNRNSCLFTTYSGSFVADQWYPLYKVDGSAIVYTGVPTSVIGYFDFNTSGYDAIALIPSGYTISFRNNNGFLEFKQSNQLSQSLNSVYALIVIWSA